MQQPPLYLHVTSTSKEGLEQAVAKIEELIAQALPDLVDQRRFRGRREPDPNVELDSRGRRKWPEERIPVDLEPIPGFNLRASVVGAQGANVKHIQQESGCRIQIKGRGSGYLDSETGLESDEDMYLHVTYVLSLMMDHVQELTCVDHQSRVRSKSQNSCVSHYWALSASDTRNSRKAASVTITVEEALVGMAIDAVMMAIKAVAIATQVDNHMEAIMEGMRISSSSSSPMVRQAMVRQAMAELNHQLQTLMLHY